MRLFNTSVFGHITYEAKKRLIYWALVSRLVHNFYISLFEHFRDDDDK